MVESVADVAGVRVERLSVSINGRKVGMLARTPEGLAAFEYDSSWIAEGFSISPYSLPLRGGVFVPEPDPFDGLFGVFHDSLPDGWGALLLDRLIREGGGEPESVEPMTRLAVVGRGGRGALAYEPQIVAGPPGAVDDLDAFARLCRDILDNKPSDNLDEAYAAAGSSAGARPKAYVMRDGTEWLVKFPSSMDPSNIGAMEYAYSVAARRCGLNMPRTELFASKACSGFFATQRFDREAGHGVHMVSASGMLEVTHRLPLLDYRHLFQVTAGICRDESQLWDLFRLMCFNVFAHNQDDHSNNFAWLCRDGVWKLSPAYDLTYSTSYSNEHATSVMGNGKPGMEDVMALADEVGLRHADALAVARAIDDRCRELLASFGLSR